jgi:hypothetical protein
MSQKIAAADDLPRSKVEHFSCGTALVPTVTSYASRSSMRAEDGDARGRSETNRHPRPVGWGSKGRRFKSDRPDSSKARSRSGLSAYRCKPNEAATTAVVPAVIPGQIWTPPGSGRSSALRSHCSRTEFSLRSWVRAFPRRHDPAGSKPHHSQTDPPEEQVRLGYRAAAMAIARSTASAIRTAGAG